MTVLIGEASQRTALWLTTRQPLVVEFTAQEPASDHVRLLEMASRLRVRSIQARRILCTYEECVICRERGSVVRLRNSSGRPGGTVWGG